MPAIFASSVYYQTISLLSGMRNALHHSITVAASHTYAVGLHVRVAEIVGRRWCEHLRARSSSALMPPPLPLLASRAACHVPQTGHISARLGSSQHAGEASSTLVTSGEAARLGNGQRE